MSADGYSIPIKTLSFQNCELYICHADGYKTNTRALLNRISEIEVIFLSKPSHAKFRVWYNLDENNLNKQMLQLIAESILRFQLHIHKIAFIGLRTTEIWLIENTLKQFLKETSLCRKYFSDADVAKGWLI